MSPKIIVTTAQMECALCPTTIIGRTPDGCTVYARYRWGRLSVKVDPPVIPRRTAARAGVGYSKDKSIRKASPD